MKHSLLFEEVKLRIKLNEPISEDITSDIEVDLISELKPKNTELNESVSKMTGSGWSFEYLDEEAVILITESIEDTVRDVLDEYGVKYKVL